MDSDDDLVYENLDYKEAEKRFKTSESVIRHRNVERLHKRFSKLQRNLDEFSKSLNGISDSDVENLENNSALKIESILDLDYKLLMTTTSIVALQELFEIALEGYESTPIYEYLTTQNNKQLDSNTFQFLKDLRQYVLHYNFVTWTVVTNIEEDFSIGLDRQTLLDSSLFRGRAKKFLREGTDLLQMDRVVDEYTTFMRKLWLDIFNKMSILDKKDVIVGNQLISESNLALSGGKFKSADEYRNWLESLTLQRRKSIPISSYLLDFRPVYSC